MTDNIENSPRDGLPIPVRAISVRAPWWWFILHGGKDVENRDWKTSHLGPVLLHASKWYSMMAVQDDMEYAADAMRSTGYRPDASVLSDDGRLTHQMLKASAGCIVGQVEIVDCVTDSANPWFFGRHGFVLRNQLAFPTPIPCKGALGFFKVPDEALAQVAIQIKEATDA